MAHGLKIVLLTIDHLQAAVAQEFSVRYCPHSKAIFLTRFWGITALCIAVAALLFFAGNRRKKSNASAAAALYAGACALLLFTLGSGALVLYGLSGCSGPAAEGLIWEWP